MGTEGSSSSPDGGPQARLQQALQKLGWGPDEYMYKFKVEACSNPVREQGESGQGRNAIALDRPNRGLCGPSAPPVASILANVPRCGRDRGVRRPQPWAGVGAAALER